ncbi:MAG TPA: hypothetical protein VF781_11905 [Solirubrobacteraceae bacterium]
MRIWRDARGLTVALVTLGALLWAVTSGQAASPSQACAPAPSTSGTGYWTPFGDSQWTGTGLLTASRADPSAAYGVTCGGASVYGQALPTTSAGAINALSFDFNPSLSGASGSSPRLVVCFSDGAVCNGNGNLAPTQWVAGSWTHVDGLSSSNWTNSGGSCGNRYSQTWSQIIACHPGATVTQVAVVNDSGSLYGSGEQVLLNNLTVNNLVAHATPPILGVRATVIAAAGTVRVRRPGSHRFLRIKTLSSVPYGTVINAGSGTVRVIAARVRNGTQSGEFYAGSFSMHQNRQGVVQAGLSGRPTGCDVKSAARIARAPSSVKLWGHVKGHFQTRGAFGSASVRGTIWLTENRCDGTYFHVVEGTLWIRDFTRHRSVILRRGQSYLAPSALPRHKDGDGDYDHDA